MLLYIVRHGIPDYATDSLTPDGWLQAKAVARRLAVHGIDEVYASPLGRAKQTAQPTCEALGLAMHIEPWMSEGTAWKHFCCDLPDGRGTWAFNQRGKILGNNEHYTDRDSFHRGFYRDDALAAQGASALAAASDEFLSRLGYTRTGEGNGYRVTNGNDRRIAAFCHQGFGLHWLSHLLNIPYHIFTASFDISHTGVSIIRFSGSEIAYPQCLCLSDLSHIYGDGLPLRYHNHLDI